MNLLGAVKFPPIERRSVATCVRGFDLRRSTRCVHPYLGDHPDGGLPPRRPRSGLVPRGFRRSRRHVRSSTSRSRSPASAAARPLPLLVSFFSSSPSATSPRSSVLPDAGQCPWPAASRARRAGHFVSVGVRHGGPGYFKGVLFPPGVPGLYLLVTPIRLDLPGAALQPRRPSLRQHARRPHPAHHLRRAVHRSGQLGAGPHPDQPSPAAAFTAFEVGVSLIQAFVFTILAAVYIGGALHRH